MSFRTRRLLEPDQPERKVRRREKVADRAAEALDAAVGGVAGAAVGAIAGPVGIAVGAATGAAVGAILGHSLNVKDHEEDRRTRELDDVDAEEEFFGAPRTLGAEPPVSFRTEEAAATAK